MEVGQGRDDLGGDGGGVEGDDVVPAASRATSAGSPSNSRIAAVSQVGSAIAIVTASVSIPAPGRRG